MSGYFLGTDKKNALYQLFLCFSNRLCVKMLKCSTRGQSDSSVACFAHSHAVYTRTRTVHVQTNALTHLSLQLCILIRPHASFWNLSFSVRSFYLYYPWLSQAATSGSCPPLSTSSKGALQVLVKKKKTKKQRKNKKKTLKCHLNKLSQLKWRREN